MTPRNTFIGAGAIVMAAAMAPQARAQTPQVDVTGSVRASLWSGSRDLDDAGPVPAVDLWVRGTAKFGDNQSLVADGWLQASDRRSVRNQQARLRELFWKARLGDVDLRIGRQLIVWGRADGINPTDSIGRRHFTQLTTEDADQREGADGVSATYTINERYSLQGVWVPRFRSDVIPFSVGPMQTLNRVKPASRSQFAVKLDHTGGDVDWSVSYFSGYDRMPDLSIGELSASGIRLDLSSHRVQVLGADFSTNVGDYVVRGEVAWSQRDKDNTASGFFRKRSQLMLVLGGDRNFGDSLNVNLQLFGQWVPDQQDPGQLADMIPRSVAVVQAAINNQSEKFQYGVTYRIAKSWNNDTWQAELSGVHSLTTHGNYVRGSLKHAINDNWRVHVGFENYRGAPETVFGQLRKNSAAYAEVRYVF
jgi:hypothetical protein